MEQEVKLTETNQFQDKTWIRQTGIQGEETQRTRSTLNEEVEVQPQFEESWGTLLNINKIKSHKPIFNFQ